MTARQSYAADQKVIDSAKITLVMAIGRWFHSHRVALDLSQEALAAAVGTLTQVDVSAVENGICVQRSHLTDLAKHLGIDQNSGYLKMYLNLI